MASRRTRESNDKRIIGCHTLCPQKDSLNLYTCGTIAVVQLCAMRYGQCRRHAERAPRRHPWHLSRQLSNAEGSASGCAATVDTATRRTVHLGSVEQVIEIRPGHTQECPRAHGEPRRHAWTVVAASSVLFPARAARLNAGWHTAHIRKPDGENEM